MLFQFSITNVGEPISDANVAQTALDTVFGSPVLELEPLHEELGLWQADLPDAFVEEVLAEGLAERTSGNYRIFAEADC